MTPESLRLEAEQVVEELSWKLSARSLYTGHAKLLIRDALVAFAVRAVDAELAELKDEYIPKLNWSVITVRELIAEIDRRRAELSPEGGNG